MLHTWIAMLEETSMSVWCSCDAVADSAHFARVKCFKVSFFWDYCLNFFVGWIVALSNCGENEDDREYCVKFHLFVLEKRFKFQVKKFLENHDFFTFLGIKQPGWNLINNDLNTYNIAENVRFINLNPKKFATRIDWLQIFQWLLNSWHFLLTTTGAKI